MWFSSSSASWILGTRADEGTNTGFIQLAEDVASPELFTKPWKEFAGGSWGENRKIFVNGSFSKLSADDFSTVLNRLDHCVDTVVSISSNNSLMSCLGVDRRSNWQSIEKRGLDD